jgi:hypothetical protein
MTTWTSRAAALKRLKRVARVQQRNSALFVTICSLRQELETKTDATRKLEILLAERCATIDALRYANQKLHLENDCLMAMLIAPMPATKTDNTATLEQKQ